MWWTGTFTHLRTIWRTMRHMVRGCNDLGMLKYVPSGPAYEDYDDRQHA